MSASRALDKTPAPGVARTRRIAEPALARATRRTIPNGWDGWAAVNAKILAMNECYAKQLAAVEERGSAAVHNSKVMAKHMALWRERQELARSAPVAKPRRGGLLGFARDLGVCVAITGAMLGLGLGLKSLATSIGAHPASLSAPAQAQPLGAPSR